MSEATTTLPGPTARTMPLPARRALLVPVLRVGLLALLPLAVALGLPSQWLTLVTRAIRLFPDTPGFQAQAGMAYAAKEDLPRAIEAFGEAEKLGAAGGALVFNHRFHFRFGVVLEQAERYEAAEAQLRKSIEMTPESEGAFRATR